MGVAVGGGMVTCRAAQGRAGRQGGWPQASASLMDRWLCRAADRGQAGGQRHVTERERREEKGEQNGSDLGSVLIENGKITGVYIVTF